MDPGLVRLALFFFAAALVVGISLVGAASLLLSRLQGRSSKGPSRVTLVAWGLLAAGLGAFLFGVFVEADWLEVEQETVETSKLARGVRYRVVHLSDLHVEERSAALDELADRVNALEPDLVVFTGDSLNAEEGLPILHRTLGALRAKDGVVAVRGNHDVWYWDELPLFDGVAVEPGAEPIRVASGRIALCGAPYGVTGHLASCIGAAKPAFTLVAYHTPDLVEDLAPSGPDLYLAGHTHGGQVRVPIYGALVTFSKFDKRYEMGRYQVGPTTLYVNRGIGFEPGPLRVRFLCRPEITVLDVVGTGD